MNDVPPPPTRVDPPLQADEATTLLAFLDFHRETLLWKVGGLTDEQLKAHAVPASNLTLLGLVRHMAEVERGWFAQISGLDATWIFCTEDNRDGDFDDIADADVQADLATYHAEVAKYRSALPGLPLDTVRHGRNGRDFSLRWILCHMIEEYARHNGHADLLRETIDGATGE